MGGKKKVLACAITYGREKKILRSQYLRDEEPSL